MKKIFLLSLLTISIISCSQKWEYKTITYKGSEQDALAKFATKKST